MPLTKGLMAVASIYGAAGVALLAAGSHAAGGLATTAGQMLLFHAPLLIAGALAIRMQAIVPALGRIALLLIAVGCLLFSGDLALRSFNGYRLLPMAAPTGGIMTIVGWLVLVLAALAAPARAK